MAEEQTGTDGSGEDRSDEPAAGGTDDVLVDELRALARTRSASQFHDHPTPTLDELARIEDGPSTDRQLLIDRGITAIPYPQYREAAQALLGSGADRWQPLTKRGETAASMFEVGYDGFRRAKTSGPSLLDETLGELARAIRLVSGGDGSAGATAPAPTSTGHPVPPTLIATPTSTGAGGAPVGLVEPTEPAPLTSSEAGGTDAGSGNRRRRLALVLALAALLAIGAILSIVTLNRSDSETADVTEQSTDDPAATAVLGADPVDDPSSSEELLPCTQTIEPPDDPELVPFGDAFRAEQASLDQADIGCPSGAIQRWDSFVFQQFAEGTHHTGVLAAVTPDEVIWFTEAQWGSYHQVGGKSGDNAQSLIGLAQAPEQMDGYVIIRTDTDSVLVGETHESPFFFVLGPARHLWEQEGGAEGSLGLPTSNPVVAHGALTQDFVGGSMMQAPDATISFQLVPDPSAELPPLSERAEGILRQTDATSWYIGADDRRYWIADGEMWDCKGGTDALVANDVPGYAIASLPYGGPATC